MPIKDKKVLKVWLALTLSVLFFHPLFATLHDKKHIYENPPIPPLPKGGKGGFSCFVEPVWAWVLHGKSERGRLCPLR
jgi:hypothetical protein